MQKLPPAGAGRRFGAVLVDAVLVGLLCYLPGTRGPGLPGYVIGYVGFMFGLGIRTSELAGMDRGTLARLAGGLAVVLGGLVYFVLCEVRGQTLGKRMFGIRVIPAHGDAFVTLGQAVGRSLAFVLTIIPAGIGQLAMLWDPKRRTWPDVWTGTRVVRVGLSGRVDSLARPVLTVVIVTSVLSVGVPAVLLVAPLKTILKL